MSIERIRYRHPQDGSTVGVWAENVREAGPFLRFVPLNRQGEDRSYYDGDTLVVVEQMLETALVIDRRPARQNPTYGTLEVVKACEVCE